MQNCLFNQYISSFSSEDLKNERKIDRHDEYFQISRLAYFASSLFSFFLLRVKHFFASSLLSHFSFLGERTRQKSPDDEKRFKSKKADGIFF